MDLAVASNFSNFRQRFRRTLLEYSRGELRQFISELERYGEVGVFGGVLRDSAISYPSAFKSDVDIVVDVVDNEFLLDSFLLERGGRVNRFGGYRIRLSRGLLDVWPLRRTWAFAVGLRQGGSLADLLGTTYFSWDSIVYSWSANKLYCRDSYLDEIRRRVVDLELAANPNPLGALVRTLRISALGRARLGPRLVRNTQRLIKRFANKEILSAEARGFRVSYLNDELLNEIRRGLLQHEENAEFEPLHTSFLLRQLEFSL
ncbi:hypothetical protein ACN28S_65290 [Cystobacter fuscus]